MCKVSPPCVSLSVRCIDLDFPQCVLVCLSRYKFITNALKSHECRNYTLGVLCARGEAEGCKTHRGFNFYSILRQQTHFECPKRS